MLSQGCLISLSVTSYQHSWTMFLISSKSGSCSYQICIVHLATLASTDLTLLICEIEFSSNSLHELQCMPFMCNCVFFIVERKDINAYVVSNIFTYMKITTKSFLTQIYYNTKKIRKFMIFSPWSLSSWTECNWMFENYLRC